MKLCPRAIGKPERRVPPQWRPWLSCAAAVGLVLCSLATPSRAQDFTTFQREQAEAMLRDVSNDVKKNYFDPLALGADWDAKVRATTLKIEHSESMNQALSHIAALLDTLNDSHTFFVPPARPFRNEYGFQMQMIGNRCFVTRVRPHSDAQAKGIIPGDEIVTVDAYAPTREDMWRMKYVFWVLQPQADLRLGIRSTSGGVNQVDVKAEFQELAPVSIDLTGSAKFDAMRAAETQYDSLRPQFAQRNDLLAVKVSDFALSTSDIDKVLEKMQGHSSVVLDLRGNPGGNEDAVQDLLGGMFDKPVKIGDRVGRRAMPPIETKPHPQTFTGKLLVLLDSESGSAAEVFARVIQIQKRGLVLGDRSAGRVMAARRYMHQVGVDSVILYGTSVTDSEIRVADGQSLEHDGVIPDKLILPSKSDLANGGDPVMAEAAGMLNVKMSPQEAGVLFPPSDSRIEPGLELHNLQIYSSPARTRPASRSSLR